MTKVDTTKYSNLTEALGNGKPVDFMGLDKRNAVLVNGKGEIAHYVVLDRVLGEYRPDTAKAWRMWDKGYVNSVAVGDADTFCYWNGESGWSLWIEGGIPVKLPTADTLEPGSVFVGKNLRITEPTEFVVAHSTYADEEDITVAYPLGVLDGDCFYASGVDVIEVKSGGFLDG